MHSSLLKTLLVLTALLWSSCSFSAEQVVDTVGYGNNRNQAISDALVQGLRQATGVSIDSREVMQTLSGHASSSNNEGEQFSNSFEVAHRGDLSLKTKGLISRYDVHSVEQEADGIYRADVSLHVLKYDKPGLPTDSRRTLAIMPFHSDKGSYSLLGDRTSATKIESELRNRALDQFIQSRKMNVLDREFGAEFQQEKALWLSDDAALAEKAKTGNVLGADYIVVGNIRNVRSTRHTKTLQLTGETIVSYSGSAQLDYKIILASTRQVKWSDSINLKFSDRDIRAMLKKYGSSQAGIIAELAEQLAQQALANIYPMRVVAVKGKTVVINQGGKTLKKGDVLNVFLLGDEMFDPYTKESLGQLEEQIATVKVLRTTAKISYATTLSGEPELIEPNFILRR
ncbi:hypothetical protein [Amphritea sp.]|uniref:hypothetical protein n=1 Tax=Amphritea sp. TaxID=1872502 RepID=UPI003A8D19F9